MKKVITGFFFVAVLMLSISIEAQIKTPAASPSAKMESTVGLTDITLEYSRPSMKDRKIFAADGLVPFGKMWRTGANAVTKVTFSDDVKVEGAALKAGTYGITSVPNATSWKVNFYEHEGNSWSAYKEKTPAATVTVEPQSMPMSIETFLFIVGDIKGNNASLEMLWENTFVSMNVEVAYDEKVMANIDKVLAGPTAGDYYNAGSYYYENGKDLDKALMYVQKATAGDSPRFWQVKKESEILAKMGKSKEAIAAAKKSLALAETAGNADYIKMNKANIAKWMKM